MADRLVEAALELTSKMDLARVLQGFVDEAAALTGAAYSALGVLNHVGKTTIFVHHGVAAAEMAVLGDPPAGHGVLGKIPAQGHVLIPEVAADPDFGGWPDGHPRVRNFLGLPLRLNGQVFGRIYLADKPDGFTAEDIFMVEMLARAAGIAISNCRRQSQLHAQEGWLRLSQEITAALLEGTGEEEALQLIASKVRHVADADACLLILPSVGGVWAGEIVDGPMADELLGITFPDDGRAVTVLRRGVGVIVDSLSTTTPLRVRQLRRFGPALYAPLMLHGTGLGVILLLRQVGAPGFEASDLAMAEAFAQQAALAMELASARHSRDLAQLLDERQRIGRDLHDLAIQQLFAAGMQMETARVALAERNEGALAEVLDAAVGAVHESVLQIREIIHSLRDQQQAPTLVERLRHEAALGRTALGFFPDIQVRVDGRLVAESIQGLGSCTELAERVHAELADDLVAVVREGLSNVARHAQASAVRVRIEANGRDRYGQVGIRIEDDGRGLDPLITRRSGVDNLAARARRRHGYSELASSPSGSGSVLVWEAPLA